jgi:hypothetical protein
MAAQRQLAGVAADGLALGVLFLLCQFEAEPIAETSRQPGTVYPMRQAQARRRAERAACQRKIEKHRASVVVRVQFEKRGACEHRGVPADEVPGQDCHDRRVATEQARRQALVGKIEKHRVIGLDTQAPHGSQCLVPAKGGPAGAVERPNPPTPLQERLRPGVVFAARDEDDAHRAARAERSLDQASRRQSLVIGVNSDYQDTVRCCEVQCLGHKRARSTAGEKGDSPCATALSQTTASGATVPAGGRKTWRPGASEDGPR